jgi:small subunit ribosomal protein S6
MRAYESLVIIEPTADDAEFEKIITRVEETITNAGGVIDSTDKWGKRRLAYEIKKHNEGYYVLFNFKGTPSFVTELDKLYRFTPLVMRSMTTMAVPEKYRKAKPDTK